jgi:hypothetical protein
MHSICAAQYTGSHLCHIGEYGLANSATIVPAGGAWTDASGFTGASAAAVTTLIGTTFTGRYTGSDSAYNCLSWTTASATTLGTAVYPGAPGSPYCNVARPLACCTTPYREKFMGLAGSVQGNLGSREAMHAVCAAQYAGSHMCHMAEYTRATSPVTLPAGGAWVDANGFGGGSAAEVTLFIAPVNVGRYTGSDSAYNCLSWTSASATTLGSAVYSGTPGSPYCNIARPIACCS